MTHQFSRRSFAATIASFAGACAMGASHRPSHGQQTGRSDWRWSLPIGLPGGIPGNGFYLRHGYATENSSFYPGGWHTGENFYLLDGDTAGTEVYAVADGEIVFAGFDYPGPVVIIRHEEDLYSMYGHLDYDLAVESGPVTRGQLLGTILDREDGRSPSHLHFEIRRFLTTPEVNGASPRYSFTCGPECPPGPGYWPIDAPEHPSAMGWMNPMHAIAFRSFGGEMPDGSAEVMVARGARGVASVWNAPDDDSPVGEMDLVEGDRHALLDIDAAPDDSTGTSAEAYDVWYQIDVPELDAPGWVRPLRVSDDAFGSDGRSSSLRFDFLPYVEPSTE